MNSQQFRQCPGCKSILPYQDYPADNRYGVHSPECRKAFDEIIAKEGLNEWLSVHRLIVDSYSVQHPPHSEIQKELGIEKRFVAASIQSIAIHLIALYLAIEKKVELQSIAPIMNKILTTMSHAKKEFEILLPPHDLGAIKAYEVNQAFTDALTEREYKELAWKWAHSSWHAWKQHHAMIKQWYEKYS